MLDIIDAYETGNVDVARSLFREYQESIGIDLSFQGFDAELKALPGDYARPGGRLLLAIVDAEPAGCIAMRPLTNDDCEMKRLYVRPQYRREGVAKQLAERIIAEARLAGYRTMYLDTLADMVAAQRLYRSLGFEEVPAYRENPIDGARFMALRL